MVDILNPPVQTGDSFSTRYEGTVSTTSTDYKFTSVQDSIIVYNYGFAYVTATVAGKSVRVGPNGGYYRFTEDSDTVSLKASSAASPFMIEGRSFSSSQGTGIDTVARAGVGSVDAKIGSNAGLPAWLVSSLYDVSKQLDDHVRQYGVNVRQPPFNAKGDGSPGDAVILQSAMQYAFDNGRLSLYLPNGTYSLDATLQALPYVDIVGQSKEGTILQIDHNAHGMELMINKLGNRPLQGGAAKYRQFTIRRKDKPTAPIPGNYGIYTKGTFNVTIFEEIFITYMGDHGCYQFDPSTAGTGPIYYNNCLFQSNFFGYGYYAKGTFVNVYFNGTNSWGNGGGWHFDGTKTSEGGSNASSYLPNNIVIQNSDSEYAGGYHERGGAEPGPPSGKAYTKPVIYAKRISNLVIKDSVLHNAINFIAGHADYITGVSTVDLVSCLSVSIENTQMQNKLGAGNSTLTMTGCDYVVLNTGTMLFGYKPGTTENADYLLKVDSTNKNVMLFNPKIADGNADKDVYLDGSVNPIYVVKNAGQAGFLRGIHDNAYWKLNLIPQGTTANRPTVGISVGLMYFDTTLQKPVWWSGSVWKDATGTTV